MSLPNADRAIVDPAQVVVGFTVGDPSGIAARLVKDLKLRAEQ